MKLKLVFVSSYFPPVTYGGVEKHIIYLCEELSRRGVACVVVTKHYPGLPKLERRSDAEIYRLGFNPFQYSTRRYFGPLTWAIGNFLTLQSLGLLETRKLLNEASLVHSHLGTVNDVRFGDRVSAREGIPHIITVHGKFGSGAEDLSISSSLLNTFLRADEIIVNRLSSQDYLRNYGISNVTFLENPIPVSSFLRPKEMTNREKKLGKRVLFVGRLTHRRGADLAFEGFVRAAKQSKEIDMWIVGDGPLMNELRRKVKSEGLKNRVSFFGKQSETSKFYWQSDIFLATSPIANSPSLSLREAMAAGLLVIATDVEYTSQVVTDSSTGFIVAPSPEAISSAIIKAVENGPVFKEVSSNAVKFAEERFDIGRYVSGLIDIYKGSLEKRGEFIE